MSDLITAGYVDRVRDGRRNTYTVRGDLPVELPTQRDIDLNALLAVLLPSPAREERRPELATGL